MLNVHIDGACRGNPGQCGIGVFAKLHDKVILEISEYIGHGTNNIAEYSALIRGLEEVLLLGHKEAHFISDSELLVKQMNGEYRVKDEKLKPLFIHANNLIKKLKKFSIAHVMREHNKRADDLANKALDNR